MQSKIRWSDDEILSAWRKADRAFGFDRSRGKFSTMDRRWTEDFLTALGAVHPHEVREREREACRKMLHSLDRWELYSRNPDRVIDDIYPSLAPQSPPPLVLSDGSSWNRMENPPKEFQGPWCWHGKGGVGGGAGYRWPDIRSASDARALAEWLEKYGSEEERK